MKSPFSLLVASTIALSVAATPAYAQYRYNASDAVKYALSAHGITYLLRDKRGSVNAWKQVSNLERYTPKSGRWGNTDCSGLVSAALRYNGYSTPERRGKPSLSTALIGAAAQRKRHGLSFIGGNARQAAQHGDLLNRVGSPYGHVFMYNGQTNSGVISTVEAKCTRCGVGRFTKSWNDTVNGRFKLVRANYIYNDVSNRNQIIPLSQADASNRTYSGRTTAQIPDNNSLGSNNVSTSSGGTVTVQSGDTGARIAQRNGISFSELQRANPGTQWNRLQIGQTLNLPGTAGSSSSSSSSAESYTVRSGDTGARIASRHGVSFSALSRANPGVNWNRLQVGQSLNIPS